jgi:hypothetical protein
MRERHSEGETESWAVRLSKKARLRAGPCALCTREWRADQGLISSQSPDGVLSAAIRLEGVFTKQQPQGGISHKGQLTV